jgi:hypothetical protein
VSSRLAGAAIIGGPGRLAQLGEHQLDKLGVTGSSPVPPIRKALLSGVFRSQEGNGRRPRGRDWVSKKGHSTATAGAVKLAAVETVCVKVKLKPGSLEQVHEWADELRSRADEVLATLRDEGVAVESVFLDSNEQGDFLVYYMKARSLSAAREAAERSSHPIDAYHERFKAQTWESRSSLELLVDFEDFA